MAPQVGFEPTITWLTAKCSANWTIEEYGWNGGSRTHDLYLKRVLLLYLLSYIPMERKQRIELWHPELKTGILPLYYFRKWRQQWDLNPWLLDWQSSELTNCSILPYGLVYKTWTYNLMLPKHANCQLF